MYEITNTKTKNTIIDINTLTLKQLRLCKGVTGVDIATKLKISKQNYSQKELNQRPFKLEELTIIANILDIELDTLMILINNKKRGGQNK